MRIIEGLFGESIVGAILDLLTQPIDGLPTLVEATCYYGQKFRYAMAEISMLLKIYEKDPLVPLFVLSDKTSEQIFSFQNSVAINMDIVVDNKDLLWHAIKAYIPKALVKNLGR